MSGRAMRALVALAPALVAWGCSGGGGDEDAGPDADASPDADAGLERPPEICLRPPELGPGPYFSFATSSLGLDPSGLDIQGGRVSTTDLEGDRFPDLVLSRGVRGDTRDDPAEPVWNARVLRNVRGSSFEDVSMSSGLLDTRDGEWGRPTHFMIFADLDNDGDLDAFTGTYVDADTDATGDRSEVMLNAGDGTFSFGPEGDFSDHATLAPVVSASFVDRDLDGVLDLYVGHHYGRYGYISSSIQDSLHDGLGDGSFVDATDEAGVRTWRFTQDDAGENLTHKPTWGVSACDVDGDGWPDLMSAAYGRQFNTFWHNTGDGTYEDLSLATGFASDDDEDYSDNIMYQCHCHVFGGECDPMPPRPPGCLDSDNWSSTDEEPWRLGGNSSMSLCGDLDGDGDLDVLAVELTHAWAGGSSDQTEILINDGAGAGGVFSRPGAEATGLTRVRRRDWDDADLGGALVDFDNDGRLDVLVLSSDYPNTSSLLWRQRDDGTFVEVGEEAGARIDRAHGVTLVDYDRDGDYDLVIGTSLHRWYATDRPPRPEAAYMYVLRNEVGQDRNRVMVHLEGAGPPGANRSAVGARIEVRSASRLFVREVSAGAGLDATQHDPLQIIGVGELCRLDEVVVRWPNREHTVTTIPDVPANYVLVVREGEPVEFQTLDEYVGR